MKNKSVILIPVPYFRLTFVLYFAISGTMLKILFLLREQMIQFIDWISVANWFLFTCFFNFHVFSSLDLSFGFSLSQAQYCFTCISKRSHAYLVILVFYVPGHTAEISSANPLMKLGTHSKKPLRFGSLTSDTSQRGSTWCFEVHNKPLSRAFPCWSTRNKTRLHATPSCL